MTKESGPDNQISQAGSGRHDIQDDEKEKEEVERRGALLVGEQGLVGAKPQLVYAPSYL